MVYLRSDINDLSSLYTLYSLWLMLVYDFMLNSRRHQAIDSKVSS